VNAFAKPAQEAGKVALKESLTARQRELRRSGLTRKYYREKLKSLCDATKPISCIVAHGKEKDADSQTTDFIEVPDNAVQLKATIEVIKLWGDYPAEKKELSGPGGIPINPLPLVVNLINEPDVEPTK
jgi:hypothetical protein